MRPPTFNFVPAHHARPKQIEQSKRTVTVNVKQGYMYFSVLDPEAIITIGHYIKFFIDTEKNTLAWKIFSKGEISDLKHLKLIEDRIDPATGKRRFIRVGVGKALKGLKVEEKTYKKIELGIYNPQGLLEDKKPYYYIALK